MIGGALYARVTLQGLARPCISLTFHLATFCTFADAITLPIACGKPSSSSLTSTIVRRAGPKQAAAARPSHTHKQAGSGGAAGIVFVNAVSKTR
jgi:hypothetical protein